MTSWYKSKCEKIMFFGVLIGCFNISLVCSTKHDCKKDNDVQGIRLWSSIGESGKEMTIKWCCLIKQNHFQTHKLGFVWLDETASTEGDLDWGATVPPNFFFF